MICSYCNKELPDGSIFCGYCGNKLAPAEVNEAASGSSEPVNDAVQQVAEATAEQVSDVDTQVSDLVGQAYEAAAQQVSGFEGQVSDLAGQAYDAAAQQVSGFEGQVSDLAGQAYEATAEQVSGVETQVSDLVGQAYDAAAQQVSGFEGQVSDLAGQAYDAAAQQVSGVETQASELAGQAYGMIPQPTYGVEGQVPADQSYGTVPQPTYGADGQVPMSQPYGMTAEQAPGNASWFANDAEQISGGYSAPGQTPQGGYAQPDMGSADAVFAAQAPAQGNIAGGKAFDITALFKNKLFLICVGAVVLLVALIIIIVNVAAGSKTAVNPKKGSYQGISTNGESVVLYNGNVIKGTDLAYNSNKIAESYDGTKMLVRNNDELILFDNGKPVTITDELSSGNAALSDTGAVAYISDDSLYIYSGGKSKKIDEIEASSRCVLAISPDGGTVAFAEYKYSDGYEMAYSYLKAWNGKSVIDLDSKFGPQYVSNGGKLICGTDANYKFTYLKNLKPGSAEKLKAVSDIYPVSADHSKLMYYTSDGNTYYFDSGMNESIKVSSRDFDFLLPGDYEAYPQNLNSFYATSGSSIYHYTKSADSYSSEKIASLTSNAMLSADGKTIIFQKDDEIIKISVSKPDIETTVAVDVKYSYYSADSFGCDPSLNHIYYMDYEGELRYASKLSKKIGSDIDEYCVNESGTCVFLTDDGDLYYSVKGGDKAKISGMSDVENLAIYNNIFYAGTDDTLYSSTDGKSFKKVLDF